MRLIEWFKRLNLPWINLQETIVTVDHHSKTIKEETSVPSHPNPPEFVFKNIDDLPSNFAAKTVYIIGENGYAWLVAFKCPCGCDETIHLNLLPDAKPSWRLSFSDDNLISIVPSIERTVGCKSHFTLTRGEIKWWENYYD